MEPSSQAFRRAVFLERDGTMINDVGYLGRLDEVRWFPWAVDAIRIFKRAGYLVCVVTNQGGIGLGLFDESTVRAIHASMDAHLTAAGTAVDGWYFCPHHPRAVHEALRVECECRKPAPGLIRAAEREHGIDLQRSFIIGDKRSDMQLAAAIGMTGILVRTGYGEGEMIRHRGQVPGASRVCANLMEAASIVLNPGANGRTSGWP
jgi:D-glycero-D-manno-heptose 1,7-bisphosphate phosphatase